MSLQKGRRLAALVIQINTVKVSEWGNACYFAPEQLQVYCLFPMKGLVMTMETQVTTETQGRVHIA